MPSAFVPVVPINEVAPGAHQPRTGERTQIVARYNAVEDETPARLSSQLPNGVTLQLECTADDGAFVKFDAAINEGRQRVPGSRRGTTIRMRTPPVPIAVLHDR